MAEVKEKGADYGERIAGKHEEHTERILDSVSKEDTTKASLQQKVIAAATSTDKARLIIAIYKLSCKGGKDDIDRKTALRLVRLRLLHREGRFARGEIRFARNCEETKGQY